VDTSKKVKPTIEDGLNVIEGQSGRKLILDSSWNNPSGEYRVGVKSAYELFPTELKNRIKAVINSFFILFS
jgi:tripeptidyl-peptidase-2